MSYPSACSECSTPTISHSLGDGMVHVTCPNCAADFGEFPSGNPTAFDALLDAATLALPFVEMAEHDPSYKPGVVARMVKQLRKAIDDAEKSRNA